MTEFSDGAADLGVDLFGDPLVVPRGPGRPAHVPTAETRRFVNMLFVCGHKPMDVAAALGLKKTAFYEHYRKEITARSTAAIKMRGRQMLRLNAAAEAGNVAAEKALAGMIQAEQLKTAGETFADKPKAPRKGLKDQRDDAAWDAGRADDGWGPLLHGESGKPLPN